MTPRERAAKEIAARKMGLSNNGERLPDDLWTQALPEAAVELDAARYRWLRSRDLETVYEGGVFVGKTPDNVVLNFEDCDRAVDAAMMAGAATMATAPGRVRVARMNEPFYEIIERSGKCRDTEASLIRCGWFFWIYTPQWIVKFTLDEWSINQWMVGRSIIVNKPSP